MKHIKACAGSLGAKPAEVALAWLLRNPVVATTVVGGTTIEELQSDLGALSVQWTPRSWNDSARFGLGRGKRYQAYAW
jgi:aryl-alcohol dehydrogenase-like predicted oxidoreductase